MSDHHAAIDLQTTHGRVDVRLHANDQWSVRIVANSRGEEGARTCVELRFDSRRAVHIFLNLLARARDVLRVADGLEPHHRSTA